MNPNPFWKEQTNIDLLEKETHKYVLILYNDDVNTFDFVIQSLIEVCDHTQEQAEQCTWLIHYKGKCEVKNGELEDLKKRCTELLRRGLSAEIV